MAWSARKASHRPPRYWDIEQGHARLLIAPIGFLALFLIVPLLRIVVRSVSDPVFTLAHYRRALSSPVYVETFAYTAEVALVVTGICLVLAFPIAHRLASTRGFAQRLLMLVILIPLWSSVVIRSYAWMILFQRYGVVNGLLASFGWIHEPLQILQTSAAVQIAMAHILLPLMILPLASAMHSVDGTLLRAARILGAGPLRRFVRVYIPLVLPGVVAGCALVFISALGFYITPILLGGIRNMMAAVVIEQAVSVFFDWPLASALATILLLLTACLYFVFARATQGRFGLVAK